LLVCGAMGCGGVEKVSLGGDDGGVGIADATPDGTAFDGGVPTDGGVPVDDADFDGGFPSDSGIPTDDAGLPDVGLPTDSGLPPDVGSPLDSGLPPDVGLPTDSGLPPDVGLPFDSGLPPDVGLPFDSGLPPDIGIADGGVDLCDTCGPGEFCEGRPSADSCRVLPPSCVAKPTCACILGALGASCVLESCVVDATGRVRIRCMGL
jgi:hypothetical protein